jgi:hypothetical protein
MSDSETRLIDRRCRCGTHATQINRDCKWHDSVSAHHAADLQAAYLRLAATPEPKRGWLGRLLDRLFG